MDGVVQCLTGFDDGTGRHLYACGSFTSIGRVTAHRLAVFRDGAWKEVGGGLGGAATSMTVFDDGQGPALYLAGSFVTAGEAITNNVARWDGSVWSSLAGGTDGTVHAMVTSSFNESGRKQLIVGGFFSLAGGQPVSGVAAWDGDQWTAMGTMMNPVLALKAFEDPRSETKRLIAGGLADIDSQGNPLNRLFEWRTDHWHPIPGNFNSHVFAIEQVEGAIHVGGSFSLSPSGDSYLTQLRCLSPIR
jgi:hypothetical protein